jgi:C4-dicarboxylate transporter DctQ subunit
VIGALRRAADRWLWCAEKLSYVSGALLILLSLPIAYDSLARKSGHPTLWAFDISLYIMVSVIYVGVADGIRTGAHFRVHLLIERAPPKLAELLEFVDLAFVFAFGIVLTLAAGGLVHTSYSTHLLSTTLLAVPLFIPQITLLIGGVSLALEAVALAVKRLTTPGGGPLP